MDTRPWTVQVNDLVGGWVVTKHPYPLSQHDHRPSIMGGNENDRGYIIAECITEEDAELICNLLNRHEQVLGEPIR